MNFYQSPGKKGPVPFMPEGIFRAYDIRGRYPKEITPAIARQLAGAIATFLKAKKLVVGRDIRNSSKAIYPSVIEGLVAKGVEVIDIGEISTEMLYFAIPYLKAGGGIAVTASHNPPGWTGLKIARERSISIGENNGLKKIARLAQKELFSKTDQKGRVRKVELKKAYLDKIRSLTSPEKIRPFKIVVNALNGIGGEIARPILKELPLEIIELDFQPNGKFPKGAPNPLLAERQVETKEAVIKNRADMGASFDGDADRVIFFDEKGKFIPACYVIALLAESFIKKDPDKNKRIVIDPRLIWATQDQIKRAGGELIIMKAGYTFLKTKMREVNAVFAGETSGHFFYRELHFADSGLLTLLYFLELVSSLNKPVSKIVDPLRKKHPVILESNFIVKEQKDLIKKVKEKYNNGKQSFIDGISIEFKDWRFNLRPSNSEPLVRLNLEARNQKSLEKNKAELISFIKKQGGRPAP